MRNDFPFFVDNPNLTYLDSAATSQVPQVVLDVLQRAEQRRANIHRGVYDLAATVTAEFEAARQAVVDFIGAQNASSIIFTSGATASLNTVAYSWAQHQLTSDDVILISELEHHANIVPWQQLAERVGCTIRWWPIDQQYQLVPLTDELLAKVKLVAVTAASNVTGTQPPIETITQQAHAAGAVVVVDAAQAMTSQALDVATNDIDFLAFSGHKMFGPSGVGGLYITPRLHHQLQPCMTGGGMISQVTKNGAEFLALPQLLEAGTPPISQVLGLRAAIEYIQNKKLDSNILRQQLFDGLEKITGVTIHGPRQGGNALSISALLHAHDLATFLDRDGICVRAGHHCCQPLHDKLGIPASLRISWQGYTAAAEIDHLLTCLQNILTTWTTTTNN